MAVHGSAVHAEVPSSQRLPYHQGSWHACSATTNCDRGGESQNGGKAGGKKERIPLDDTDLLEQLDRAVGGCCVFTLR